MNFLWRPPSNDFLVGTVVLVERHSLALNLTALTHSGEGSFGVFGENFVEIEQRPIHYPPWGGLRGEPGGRRR
jgi:hypothetical protein